jgi:hypothetical protein
LSRRTQRLVIAALGVAILALGWAIGWREAGRWVEARAQAELAERRSEITCTNLAVDGFPFALRVGCDNVAVSNGEAGTEASLGGGAGSFRVWRPFTPRVTLVSPADIRTGATAGPVNATWDTAGADIGVWWGGPRSTRFDATALTVTAPEAMITADAMDAGVAPGSEDGLSRIEAHAEGFSVTTDGSTTLPVTLALRSEIAAEPRDILLGRYDPLGNGFALTDIALDVTDGNFHIEADGELSVDPEGVANGKLTVRIAGFEAMPAFLASLPEKLQRPASAAIGGFMAIGGGAEIDGREAREVTLDIEDGEARIGFINLGEVSLF